MQTSSAEIPTFVVDDKRKFTCPKCGKINLHGKGDGHRGSHCPCWPNGYYIVTAKPTAAGAVNLRDAVARVLKAGPLSRQQLLRAIRVPTDMLFGRRPRFLSHAVAEVGGVIGSMIEAGEVTTFTTTKADKHRRPRTSQHFQLCASTRSATLDDLLS